MRKSNKSSLTTGGPLTQDKKDLRNLANQERSGSGAGTRTRRPDSSREREGGKREKDPREAGEKKAEKRPAENGEMRGAPGRNA